MAIAKASAGSGFVGSIGYALQTTKKDQPIKLKPVLLVQNNCFGTASELAKQMRLVADGRQTVKKPVTHLMFALPPGEKQAPEKIMAALDSILADIGVQKDNNQYIVVQHRDKAHDHYHVILNRVGLDGGLLKDNFLNNRLQVAASKVEILQGFEITPNRTRKYNPESEKGYDYIKREAPVTALKDQIDKNPVILSSKKEIQAVIKLVIPTVKTLPSLKEALLVYGITVSVRENKKGDLTGISYRINEKIAVKGSDIGYSLQKIGKVLDLKNQPESPVFIYSHLHLKAKEPVSTTDLGQYIKNHLEEALLTVRNPAELEAALTKNEIRVNFLSNKNGIYGITFEHEEEKIKGTSIGYKWETVHEKIESNALIPIVLDSVALTPELSERSKRLQAMMEKLKVQSPDQNERRNRPAADHSRAIGRDEEPVTGRQPLGTRPESTGADLTSLNRNLRADQDSTERQRAADAAERSSESERRFTHERAEAVNRDQDPERKEPELDDDEPVKEVRRKGPKR